MKKRLAIIILLAGAALILFTEELTAQQAAAPDTIVVQVLGQHEDSRFEPSVAETGPGDVIRFEVREGMHTVTAYHPDNRRDLGIPEAAESFDSGMLRAGQTWYLTLTEPGEYNYFCLPHERMGHTGKIYVRSRDEALTISNRTN